MRPARRTIAVSCMSFLAVAALLFGVSTPALAATVIWLDSTVSSTWHWSGTHRSNTAVALTERNKTAKLMNSVNYVVSAGPTSVMQTIPTTTNVAWACGWGSGSPGTAHLTCSRNTG